MLFVCLFVFEGGGLYPEMDLLDHLLSFCSETGSPVGLANFALAAEADLERLAPFPPAPKRWGRRLTSTTLSGV